MTVKELNNLIGQFPNPALGGMPDEKEKGLNIGSTDKWTLNVEMFVGGHQISRPLQVEHKPHTHTKRADAPFVCIRGNQNKAFFRLGQSIPFFRHMCVWTEGVSQRCYRTPAEV